MCALFVFRCKDMEINLIPKYLKPILFLKTAFFCPGKKSFFADFFRLIQDFSKIYLIIYAFLFRFRHNRAQLTLSKFI
jgi:hypothetical protein